MLLVCGLGSLDRVKDFHFTKRTVKRSILLIILILIGAENCRKNDVEMKLGNERKTFRLSIFKEVYGVIKRTLDDDIGILHVPNLSSG